MVVMAWLEPKCLFGFGELRTSFVFIVLVLQASARVLLVDAELMGNYPLYCLPTIQSSYEPLFDLVNAGSLPPTEERSRDFYLKIRGGKLGKRGYNRNDEIESSAHIGGRRSLVIGVDGWTESIRAISGGASPPPPSKYTYVLFQENDGHESDPDGIPTRYLKMQNNKRDQAKAALENTLRWRAENDIDTILSRPHRKFDVSKEVFPHYFCGRDDTNHVILLQKPGLMNVKLADKNNLTGEELLFHYVYVMEYLWRIIDPAPDATMTSIIDLTGLNISILRKREQIRIGSLFLSTMDAHFPQRSHKTLLINAPKWFGALYKIASPLLRESTKQKIKILSKGKEQDAVLKTLLSDCPIPEGSKYEAVPPGVMEEGLRNFCLARLEEAGVEMQPVIPL